MHLSLIIPAYNETGRIEKSLRLAQSYFASRDYTSEIVVVDDGSTDGTGKLVRAAFPEVRLIAYTPNRGKGRAVKEGMLAATGAYRVFYDADASTPIEELGKLWPLFDAGADVVIGSRSLPESQVEVHQAWYRENMGRMYNRALRLLGLTRFPDTQCGFKGFTAAACETVFPRQTIDHFSFDAELLYIAAKHGLRIEQVPVRWVNEPHSRVNPVWDALQMLSDLRLILRNDRRGAYA